MRDPLALGPPGLDAARLRERLAEAAMETSLLQHDLRNMVTPALLSADILLTNADPVVAQQAEIVIKALTRIIDRVG